MSRKGKISCIWFRDDEPARRVRLHPGWLRFLAYFAVFLALAAAGGSFAGYEFWRRAQDLQSEKRDLEKRLSESLIKLERLLNIEKLLQTSDPTELRELLGGLGVEMPAAKSSAQPVQQPAAKGAKEPQKPQQPQQVESRPGLDLADIMGRVDLGQVGVENFRAKLDAKTVQVGFDLNNLMPQSSLAGSGQLLLVARDGAMVPLEASREDLAFQIQRFKQVNAHASLPAQVDRNAVFGLRLVIANASGKTIFSETYPPCPGAVVRSSPCSSWSSWPRRPGPRWSRFFQAHSTPWTCTSCAAKSPAPPSWSRAASRVTRPRAS